MIPLSYLPEGGDTGRSKRVGCGETISEDLDGLFSDHLLVKKVLGRKVVEI